MRRHLLNSSLANPGRQNIHCGQKSTVSNAQTLQFTQLRSLTMKGNRLPPERPLLDTPDPRFQILVTDDGSRSLQDTVLNESYHSGSGAAAESYVVYIRNSEVVNLLAPSRTTRVLEYGFGTGMNFIMTAALARARNAPLHYESWEYKLLPADVFELLQLPASIDAAQNLGWLTECADHAISLCEDFIRFRKSLPQDQSGCVELSFRPNITLKLMLGDATKLDPVLYKTQFDAVYFDAFSPQTNPDLWTPPVLTTAHTLLAPGGRLVTYCVNSYVRKLMTDCGFRVTKGPGPPKGKREVMIALKESVTI
jgi:tRNA U34 5-methylaminomethyl-2-thiouridine-forming methyltransferase MnmC